jgi:hypothetical protein
LTLIENMTGACGTIAICWRRSTGLRSRMSNRDAFARADHERQMLDRKCRPRFVPQRNIPELA